MLIVVTALLTGCLVNESLYLERLAQLQDADADGWTSEAGDCDDTDASRNPDAEDDRDGIDDDCDEQVDEDASFQTWYLDADQDGFGSAPTEACAAPENHAGTDGDCDDNDSGVHPGGPRPGRMTASTTTVTASLSSR